MCLELVLPRAGSRISYCKLEFRLFFFFRVQTLLSSWEWEMKALAQHEAINWTEVPTQSWNSKGLYPWHGTRLGNAADLQAETSEQNWSWNDAPAGSLDYSAEDNAEQPWRKRWPRGITSGKAAVNIISARKHRAHGETAQNMPVTR